MGFFSWKTQDTHRSIANCHQHTQKTFRVVMTDNTGRQFIEDNYDGYGVFGGKDYYELLAEINGKSTRTEGICLAFSTSAKGISEGVIYPSLSESGFWNNGIAPESCEYQGYFYENEPENEDYD